MTHSKRTQQILELGATKFDTLDEMNTFTEKQKLPKFSLEEIDTLIMLSNNVNLV